MSLFSKKIKIILFLCLFLFIPFLSQAATCTDAGGTCITTTCSALQSGTYDSCPNGEVCCSSAGATTPATPAASYQEGDGTTGLGFLEGHLVPCGRKTDDPGTITEDETTPCTLCHLFIMLKRIFNLMLSLIIVVSILLITVGGVVYIVSAGSPKLTGIAKSIITKTLIGFSLMLVGWLLVFTLLSFLSAGNMVGSSGTWYNFTCETVSSFQ